MRKTDKNIIVILLILGYVSVNAQAYDGYGENIWSSQYKLEIYTLQNKTYSTGEEAKIYIVIKNKKTDGLDKAPNNITVFLMSDKGILNPSKVTILKGETKSDDVSITSVQSGNVIIKAEAVDFNETATARLEFVHPPDPSELNLTALPSENILANGKASTKLMVKLINPDGELFRPQADKSIYISTDIGDVSQQVNISKDKPYARTEFSTNKPGTIEIIANSPDFNLEGHAKVSFISPISLLTALLALLGGFLGGTVKYFQEHKRGIGILPKRQKDSTWRLGMLGTAIFHAIFGYIVYIGASLNMPLTNVFDLPVDIWNGALLLGFTGGLFFFIVISVWSLPYKQSGVKNH